MAVRTLVQLIGLGKGLRFAESPRWHNNRLWFIDIHDSAVKSVSLNGDLQTEISLPFKPNGLGFLEDGSVLFSDALHLRMKRWDGSVLHDYADISSTSVFCLSDAIVLPDGKTYVGDIGYNFWLPDAKPVESCVITLIDPGGIVTKVAESLSFPNGMVISPDGKTLIVAETNGYRLTAFDLAADGTFSNRRLWAKLPEGVQPDGICIDGEGAVWVANPAGSPTILRVREGGEVVETILLDNHAYAVMLGGPERRHLFICTSSSHNPVEIAANPSAKLLVVEVGVSGESTP